MFNFLAKPQLPAKSKGWNSRITISKGLFTTFDRLFPKSYKISLGISLVSNECRGTTQSSPVQTARNSSASTEAAALSQFFRGPSYVQRQRYFSPYQRLSRQPTATTTSNRTSGTSNSCTGPGVASKEIILLPNPLMDNVPRASKKLFLEERGLIVSGHPISHLLSEHELISSFETLFEHVLDAISFHSKYVDHGLCNGFIFFVV